MKSVNLLPEWYCKQQRQKKNLRVHFCVMVLLGAAMGVVGFGARQRIGVMREKSETLKAQLDGVPDVEANLQAKNSEMARLETLQSAYKELGNTVPMSGVVQQIQNELTPGMAISHVLINTTKEPVKGSGMIGDSKKPARQHEVAHLEIVGVAPNDVQIAQLIGKLSSNPLFQEVSLNYTKTMMMANAYTARTFEIRMDMDLDPLATEDPDDAPVKPNATDGPAAPSASTGGTSNAG